MPERSTMRGGFVIAMLSWKSTACMNLMKNIVHILKTNNFVLSPIPAHHLTIFFINASGPTYYKTRMARDIVSIAIYRVINIGILEILICDSHHIIAQFHKCFQISFGRAILGRATMIALNIQNGNRKSGEILLEHMFTSMPSVYLSDSSVTF